MLVENKQVQETGFLWLHEGSWQQGYYWTSGMEKAKFIDKPKSLPNDIIWFTNAPYEIIKNLGIYFKSERFFRVPILQFIKEFLQEDLEIMEKTMIIGKMLKRMSGTIESSHLRDATTLASAFAKTYSNELEFPSHFWENTGKYSSVWTWQGSVKHKLLTGGNLYAPRMATINEILNFPVPNFTKPPIIVTEQHPKHIIKEILQTKSGFVSARIEKISPNVQDFISLNRTIWSSAEILWLLDRSEITIKKMWLQENKKNPLNKKKIAKEFKTFSWLDALRMESLYLSPGGKKNIAMDSYLRSINHVTMAMYAEILVKDYGISPISISFNKIGIAYSGNEREKISVAARAVGLVPDLPKETKLRKDWVDNLFDD